MFEGWGWGGGGGMSVPEFYCTTNRIISLVRCVSMCVTECVCVCVMGGDMCVGWDCEL